MPLSDIAVRNAKGREKPYKLADAAGLYVLIQPTGSRLWRMDYRFQGKRKTLAFGSYPLIGLAEARTKRDAAKRLLLEGADPGAQKQNQRKAQAATTGNTFGEIANEYLERLRHDEVAERTYQKNEWLLKRVAGPAFDAVPIATITAADVLQVLQRVEKSGRVETANRLRSALSSVFRLAVVTLRCEGDPTLALKGAIKSPKVTSRAAITDPKKLGWLMSQIDDYDGWPTLKAALLITALTACRPGEVRGAEWGEFNFEEARWSIPAPRTKMRRPHEVPLSGQSLSVLRSLHEVTGHQRLAFTSIRTAERPLSENAMNSALRRIGVEKDEHTSHGFRSSFSTIMNERGADPEIIELCLAHQDGNKIRRTYNRSIRWPDRVRMMEQWAGLLSEFRTLR